MKIFSQFLLAACILFSGQIHPAHLTSIQTGITAGYQKLEPFIRPLAYSGAWIVTKKIIKTSGDVEAEVNEFFQKKLQECGFKKDEIKIKLGRSLAAFNEFIIITPIDQITVETWLANPDNEEAIKNLKLLLISIDHEIGHLKHNHTGFFKNFLVQAGIGYATYIISNCLINNLTHDSTNLSGKCRNASMSMIIYLSTGLFAKYLHSVWGKSIEKQADDYAISQAKDPQALYLLADFFERNDKNIMSRAEDILELFCNTDVSKKLSIWIKKNKAAFKFVHFLIDGQHPVGAERAEKMRKAADALEAIKASELPALPESAMAA